LSIIKSYYIVKKAIHCSTSWSLLCGGIAYIYTQEVWLYLVVVIDLFSRKIVGWSMDGRMKAKLDEIDILLNDKNHFYNLKYFPLR